MEQTRAKIIVGSENLIGESVMADNISLRGENKKKII